MCFKWDVDSAYLHRKIDHDIYIKFPDGYDKPGKVAKLNKALYGLPEVACVWQEDLKDKLKLLGFTPLASNIGVFIKHSQNGMTAIDTHTNDITGICSSEGEETNLKTGIQNSTKSNKRIPQNLLKYWEFSNKRCASWHDKTIVIRVY